MSAEESHTKLCYINEEIARQDFIDNVLIEPIENSLHYFGRCDECNETCTGPRWCKSCNSIHFRKAFSTWTSGNLEIDYFIQNTQLHATSVGQALEWFPWEVFSDVKKIGEGGYGIVFRAKRTENAGFISRWDKQNNEWYRVKKGEYYYNEYVALKTTDSNDPLKEAKRLQRWAYKQTFVGTFLGFTKNETGQYHLVLWYYTKGNLREYTQYQEISWNKKIEIIYWIARNLNDIHQSGLIHRDLHPGNVLNSVVEQNGLEFTRIVDLGLSISLLEAGSIKDINGVVPYVAPELFNSSDSYSQATDVYAFGIIMWGISSGEDPFYNVAHDVILAKDICDGLRPEITKDTPPFYKDLIEKCWDADPKRRPTAEQIYQLIYMWYEPTQEIQDQIDKAEETRQRNIGMKKDNTQHTGAIYTSRSLKKITRELATMKLENFVIP